MEGRNRVLIIEIKPIDSKNKFKTRFGYRCRIGTYATTYYTGTYCWSWTRLGWSVRSSARAKSSLSNVVKHCCRYEVYYSCSTREAYARTIINRVYRFRSWSPITNRAYFVYLGLECVRKPFTARLRIATNRQQRIFGSFSTKCPSLYHFSRPHYRSIL